jgi:hypothetical protein
MLCFVLLNANKTYKKKKKTEQNHEYDRSQITKSVNHDVFFSFVYWRARVRKGFHVKKSGHGDGGILISAALRRLTVSSIVYTQ